MCLRICCCTTARSFMSLMVRAAQQHQFAARLAYMHLGMVHLKMEGLPGCPVPISCCKLDRPASVKQEASPAQPCQSHAYISSVPLCPTDASEEVPPIRIGWLKGMPGDAPDRLHVTVTNQSQLGFKWDTAQVCGHLAGCPSP